MKNYLSKGNKTSSFLNVSRSDLGEGVVRISQVKKVSSLLESQKMTKCISSMTASQIRIASELKSLYTTSKSKFD